MKMIKQFLSVDIAPLERAASHFQKSLGISWDNGEILKNTIFNLANVICPNEDNFEIEK